VRVELWFPTPICEFEPYPVKTGRRILFPNWLERATLLNTGASDRIIVNFNSRFVADEVRRPIRHHEEGIAMAKKQAKKRAKKRSASSSKKKKASAKKLKARPLKAKAAARVRGGAAVTKAPAAGFKDPGPVAFKDPGLTAFKDPGLISYKDPR
jgi:hypothetical protein